MRTLVLNELESLELHQDGAVVITRHGFEILVEKDYAWEYNKSYITTIVNPYEKVSVKK